MGTDLWLYMLLSSPILFILLKLLVSKFVKIDGNRPPGPPCIPIIGHLHLLKEPVHRTLHQLSQKYGHVMLLQFGVREVLVVSSPRAVEECFTKNDIVFANRPEFLAAKLVNYNSTTMGFAQYGDHWRNLRRITAVEMFSTSRLAMLSSIRQEEVRIMLQQVYELCGNRDGAKVELRPVLVDVLYNILMRMIAGKRFFGKETNVLDEEARLFQGILRESAEVHGNSNLGDYFPLFDWVDVHGVKKRMINFHKKLDGFFQKLVDERRKLAFELDQTSDEAREVNRRTLIDVMLSLQETDPKLHSDVIIKGLILAMLGAGSETTSTTLEWAMSLLLNHPEAMHKAFEEIQSCCGEGRLLDEHDLPKLTYLNNIVDETLRLYPAAPLLVPHESSADCNVCGYNIPRGTMLLVNLWTIHRDPETWEDSTVFKPERFNREDVDQGYKFIPFGAGRRACPGNTLGRRVMMLALGSLIQCFQWERIGAEVEDMSEGTGLTMPRLKSLECLCKPRDNIVNVLS